MVLCSTHHHSPQPGQIIQFTAGFTGNDCMTKLSRVSGYAFVVDPYHVTTSHYNSGFHLFSCKAPNTFHIIVVNSGQVHEYYEEYYYGGYSYESLQSWKLDSIAYCGSTWSEFQEKETVTTDLEVVNPHGHGYFDDTTIILLLQG